MLIQSHNGGTNGFGYGFGAATLSQGKDFNCNAAICYGIGAANDALFKTLQQKINVLSKIGGFTPLTVDGFIGAASIAAMQTLKKIGFSAPATKEAAAANASNLIDILTNLASIQSATAAATGQPSPLAPPGPAVAFQPSVTPTITAQLPGPSTVTAKLPMLKSKTFWWVTGGIVAALAVGGVGYVVYRRRSH